MFFCLADYFTEVCFVQVILKAEDQLNLHKEMCIKNSRFIVETVGYFVMEYIENKEVDNLLS